jgi:hypothetical protein
MDNASHKWTSEDPSQNICENCTEQLLLAVHVIQHTENLLLLGACHITLLSPPGGKLVQHTILWWVVRKQTFGNVLPLLHASLALYKQIFWKCLLLL